MIIRRQAKNTLTALEVDHGDRVEFTLLDGTVRVITLEDTGAEIISTTLKKPGVEEPGGRTIYRFWSRLRVGDAPVLIEIENGRAVREDIRCDNERLLEELSEYIFENDANSNRVGEFAIGTNTGLRELIYNLLQDEKFPGVHIAFGSPIPAKTGAKWDSKAHVDGVIKTPTITVDGEVIMDKGRFRLE